MSVLKLSKKDIINNNEDDDKIKLDRSQISYDSAMVSDWETRQKKSAATLEEYRNRINSGGFMTADDITSYRKAIDDFVSTSTELRRISSVFGDKSKEDDDEVWTSAVSSLESNYKNASETFSKYNSEEEYKTAWNDYNWRQKYNGKTYDDLQSVLADMEDGEEKEWLTSYAPTALSIDEVKDRRDSATTRDDKLFYQDLYNQKIVSQNAETLSKTKMDGTNGSVLDEMKALANMEDGPEKKKRKAAVLSKMEELGIGTADYSLYAGDSNVTWDGFWDWAGASAMSGLNSYNKGIAGTLDKYVGKPLQELGWKNNPISSAADYYSDLYDSYEYDANLYHERMGGGKGFEIGGQFIEGLIGAVPDALLAIMTAGVSKVGTLANAGVQASGSFLTKAGITAQNMAKNPQFWLSYARTYSSDYEEAKAMGADDVTAAFGATLSSLINAGIEIGFDGASGIQGLPQEIAEGGSKAITAWAMSSLEEGGEEVLQGFVNNAIAKVLYDSDTELASLEEMMMEFAMGTAIGAALGGTQTGLRSAANSTAKGIETHKENSRFKRIYGGSTENLQALVSEGLESSEGSLSRTLAEKFHKKLSSGKSLSGKEISKLVKANDQAIQAEESDVLRSETEETLTKMGETGDVSAIADIILKKAYGEPITYKEKEILDNSKYGHFLMKAVAADKQVNRVNVGKYDDALMNLAQEVASAQSPKVSIAAQGQQIASSKGNLTTVAENASKVHHEVSEDGKMVNTKTSAVIDPQGLVQAEDGTYMIAVKDAEPVASSDVSYPNENHALVVETFVNLDAHSGNTSRVIADMGLESRNALLGIYNPNINKDGSTFVNGILNTYFYGHRGVDLSTVSNDSPIWELTEQQRKFAWNIGRSDGLKATAKGQSHVDTVYAEAKKILEAGKAQKGSYHAVLEDGISPLSLNKKQKAVYQYADEIAQGIQAKIRVYAGKNKAQGFYNHETEEIWLNLNAADTGREAVMVFTLAHELVHRAKKGSLAKYEAFVDFLMKEYGKQGSDVEAMIAEQIQAAEEFNKTVPDSQKVNMTREKALEEVVCDACQRMLLDTNAGQKLAEFGAQSKENKGFLEDLKRWISELIDKLRRYFRNAKPDSLAAKDFAKFDANVKQILADMYVDMAIDSGEKLSTIKAAFGGAFAEKFLGMKDIQYNLAATESHKTKLQKEYSEDSSSDLKTIMARYEKIIDIWTRLGGELNSKFMADWNSKVSKDRTFTIFKAQAGYKYNVELSSMCKKGVPLFEAIDTIVKQEVMKELEIDVLGKAEKEILYDILKQHHFEIPCAICYVEQARQREGVIIDAFLNGKVETNAKGVTTKVKLGWNQVLESIEKEMKANGVNYSFTQVSRDIATEKYIPANLSMDSKTQVAFYAALKKIANQEISRYNKAEGKSRKLLTDFTDKAVKESFGGTLPANLKIFKVLIEDASSRFKIQKDLLYSSIATQNLSMAHNKLYGLFNSQGGVSGYKTKQGTTIYWGDILGKSWKPDTLRNEGGVRNQSNSDFQMYTLLDQAQMYLDFTAKGYYLQAYTKVLSELKLFGLSRGKINASLIPKVVVYRNADGSVDIEKTMANAGLDENGNPIYDDIEGINHDEAFMLIEDPEYSKSICGICIGYSDAHINKLLDDPRVQQIIGFHDKTDDGTKRYKGARYAKNYNGLNEAVNKEGKTVHIGFNPYVRRAEKKFKFNAETETYEGTVNYNGKTYTADDIPRLATALYLEMCAKKEYTPAYKDFAGHHNYYKLLADFGLYDSQGHYAPHRKVVYNMPDTVPYLDANGKKQTMSTYDYIKAELVKELTVRDSIAEALADTSSEGIIPQFKAAVKKAQEEKSFSLPKGDPAPTFYSHMARVVDGVKQEKLGAASVVSMLRGKGVKAEEIKWSGIEAFLEGKKSVTKAELQEFIAGSMLQIEEETLSDKEIPYSQEHLDQIAKFEAERDTIVEELKSEWKRIVGTDIPIAYFGAGLEHAVVDKLFEANATIKGKTEAGYKYKAARAALQRCIEYNDDYFGYDNERQAFREAVRNPEDFMSSYEMSSFEKGVFQDFIKAKKAYNKEEGISEQDRKALVAIAASADRFNNRIAKVKAEHRAKAAKHMTKWGQYKLKGGENYREVLFRIPGSTYSNNAMDTHWEDRYGVLAHARIQDLNTFLGKMLFIEELQSDWHNDGHKDGYANEEPAVHKRVAELSRQWDELFEESMNASSTRAYAINEKMDAIQEEKERLENKLRHGLLAPDAPFRDSYHEYVLKRLIRMAAEEGYDSIGWTPAQIQVDRWSEKFAEGYRIEYDQDIPKFLRKYGKQWDTTVGKTVLDNGTEVWSMAITDSMKDSVIYEGQVMYSLPKVSPVQPSTSSWRRTHDTDEVKAQFPDLWDVSADESEVRNPTQITGTVKSYRKIYEYLKAEGFNGSILDASSGLGYGTKAGIEEYGFDVEDIEPYPDKRYNPKYTDYASLHKKYDVIISNAVLNVLPQDQRDALVVKMASLLKAGGRIFINVRGRDVENASSKVTIDKDLMEYYISNTGSYQKGFTKPELVAYLRDALGEGYSVNPTSMFGAVSAVVTKTSNVQYSLPKEKINSPYSYDALISKPDMVVTTVGGNVPKNRADVAYLAKKNAAKVGKFDPKTGSVSVYVDDIDTDVILSTKGLRHGLRRTQDPLNEPNYIVTVKAGEILKNSIRINEITPSDENANSSYVLIGVARDTNGTYVVRFVVNHFDNNVTAMDVLYAINAKKELAALNAPRLTAEPLSVTSSTISIEELLDLVNQYFPDILPEEVLKHYGYDSRPDGDLGEDALYKLPIGEDTSPRALLANAFEGIITNDIEKRRLEEYKSKVEMLNAEEQKLRELRAEIKELSFAKGKRDTKKIKELQFDAIHTANRIATLDKVLLRLEAAAPLQSVLQREKEMAYKRAEQKGKEALEAYKKAERERDAKWQSEVKEKYQASKKKAIETREKHEAREKLQKLVLDTVKWISYPAKTEVKCPDILKQPYADFLNGIDMSSQRLANGGDPTKNDLRLANAMGSLATALDKIMTSQDPTQETDKVLDTGYLDLPVDFVKQLRDMTEKINAMMVDGDYVVNTMTAAEVRQLSQMIRTLNHAIKTMSTLYANLRFANIEALGFDTMEFMDALGEIEETSGVKDFVQWDNALPYYAFKRFGKGGESVFEGLMDAQDKLAFLAQKIFDFQEKAWTGKEAKEWSEDTHTITLPNGNELTLTTADAMSIYCLSRREHGLQHLLGGGTRVMGVQKGSKKAKDSRSLLTVKDIDAIISTLTDRQKQVAEAIQEFMSTVCSDWGNEISMKRFLTKDFAEKFYFPIESNDENLPTKDPVAQQSDLFRLLNISATKPLIPGANNEVIIRNIFDVFTGHASDMARLNAYGMALLDYMKWLNYREKAVNEEGQIKVRGVRKSMEKAYGNEAKSYVINLVKDVNGRPSDGGDPNILMKWMRNAKTASVGSSLRVATLQFTSYPRAALVLSPKSLALGLSKIPNIKRAKKYCGIALWKSFGFYDTNISRSIEDQMKGVKDVKQKLIELSLKGAEWGDAITWGCLWNACEYEVAKTTKNKVGSEEFYQEVGKKLREVVYSTQVVDSTLTRSQIMRSKRGMAQEAAAFMSEPTLSANILMDAGFQFNAEKRRSGSVKAAWQKTGKYVTKAIGVYSIGQLAAALLESFWDAWRDDDDEEFGEKFWDAFGKNLVLDLVPFNKIPIVSDLAEAVLSQVGLGYFSSDKMSTTWLTQADSAIKAWKSALSEESSTTTYNALYKTLRAISSFYGVAFSGVMREGVALWNNTAGAYDSTLKVRQYEPSKTDLGNSLYDAIISGNDRQADSIKEEFRERADDEKEYQSSVKSAIRKALRENDPRIMEAARAMIDGNPPERARIVKEIIAEGNFETADIQAAINAEIDKLRKEAKGQ